MSSLNALKAVEIDRNFAAFLKMLPNLVGDYAGQWALLRHGFVIAFYPSALDAQIAGNINFDDQIFSIQPVEQAPDELGYFSYAINPRTP